MSAETLFFVCVCAFDILAECTTFQGVGAGRSVADDLALIENVRAFTGEKKLLKSFERSVSVGLFRIGPNFLETGSATSIGHPPANIYIYAHPL